MSSNRVVVVGAAGFGRECIDVLEAMIAAGADLRIAGVVDDAPSKVNLQRLESRGIRYIGTISQWLSHRDIDEKYVLGIGDPGVRRKIVSTLDEAAVTATVAVHPTASLGSATSMAEGVVVCAGAIISTNVHLERHVHINPSVTIGHDAVLEEFVSVNPAAIISGEVRLRKEVLVGAAALVLQQLTVGEQAIVGAASLVTRHVPAGAVVVGVPGRWK